MNSKKNNNIYALSKEIESDSQAYEAEAKQIINAYRHVEQLKVDKSKPQPFSQEHPKPKLQSAYAQKVKETLSQLKNNKSKEMEHLSKYAVEPVP
jgi:hypothetical protein